MSIHKCYPTASKVALSATVVLLCLSTRTAQAHRLDVTCRVEGPKQVRVNVLFEGDTPAEGALVRMLDADGESIAEQKTDQTGTCQFTLDKVQAYTFEAVHAGHRDTCRLTQDQVAALRGELPIADVDDTTSTEAHSHAADHSHHEGHSHDDDHAHGVDQRATAEPRSTRVVAGLGFILGLCAFVMVLNQRKEIRRLRAKLENER